MTSDIIARLNALGVAIGNGDDSNIKQWRSLIPEAIDKIKSLEAEIIRLDEYAKEEKKHGRFSV